MMSEATSVQPLLNNSARSVGFNEATGEVTNESSSPDPVALALSGTVVTLLLLCLCCLCKFRGKSSSLATSSDMQQPTVVVTQRTFIHSLSMDQPPPYTPPPDFPGITGLWSPATPKCPETPPPPYSGIIAHMTLHTLPPSSGPLTA